MRQIAVRVKRAKPGSGRDVRGHVTGHDAWRTCFVAYFVSSVALVTAENRLTPAQQEVIDVLGAPPEERPVFDRDLRDELRAEISDRIAPWTGSLSPDEPLFVSKHALMTVHGCEARFVHEQSTNDFDWTVPFARGAVVHKAIELSIHWRGSPLALDLVDESLARLTEQERSLGVFLQSMSESDRAQLRSDTNDQMTAFMETWPKLQPAWRPVTEGRVRAEFLGGRVVASGKVDLTLGQPDGLRAGKVIIDLKTGRTRSTHRDDLRFYSLLETLRIGTPPRLCASYYLDQGMFTPEVVSVDTLRAATERFISGVEAMVELKTEERDATKRVSAGCRWCPVRTLGCAEGDAHLAERDGTEGSDF